MPTMARTLWLAFLLLASACWMTAQTPPLSRSLTIVLPPGIPSETTRITYALVGSFGSHGQTTEIAANETSYTIATSVDGKPADSVQIVVWAPGCETRTHSLDLRKSAIRRITYGCVPHPAVTLTGRIIPFEATRAKDAELAIFYRANWECVFFGWNDCMVPQFAVATVTPRSDGTFEAQLPDFTSDPVVAASAGSRINGDFLLLLRDPKTLNHIAELEPELEDYRSIDGSLKSVSEYPSDLVFVPQFAMK